MQQCRLAKIGAPGKARHATDDDTDQTSRCDNAVDEHLTNDEICDSSKMCSMPSSSYLANVVTQTVAAVAHACLIRFLVSQHTVHHCRSGDKAEQCASARPGTITREQMCNTAEQAARLSTA